MGVLVEVCCGSADDAAVAARCGAGRVELNSALALGGLTPTVAALRRAKREASLPVCCMVRPRGAGFCYSDAEFAQMLEDAEVLLDDGADGIVFGFLSEDATVDVVRTKRMASLVHARGGEAIFHRAVDVTPEVHQACAQLVSAGVDRVLTSGGAATAPQGAATIADLVRDFGGAIQILAGSGVNAQNVADLVRATGVRQVHASCRGYAPDPTTVGPGVSYAYLEGDVAGCYDVADPSRVHALVAAAGAAGARL